MEEHASCRVNQNMGSFREIIHSEILSSFGKTAKRLEENRNFKQEMDETLYQAWERFNDLLFRCSQHDMNNQQKVQILYRGLDILSRQMLDSQGLIPMMSAARALKSIQDMAYYSQNWLKKPVLRDLPIVNPYLEPFIPPIPFLWDLKEQEDEAQALRTLKGLKKVKINRPMIHAVKKKPEYVKYVKDVFFSNKSINDEDAVKLNDKCSAILQS
ncbi:hypothetical protein Tco_1480554 [Tanacetum coccineum]